MPVYRIRYLAVILSGFLAGLGGAWLAIDVRAYNQGQTAGRGFQGLAAMIFGNWRPLGIFGGAGVFAYAQALTQRIGTAPVLALFILAAIVFTGLGVRLLTQRQLVGGLVSLAVVPFVLYYYSITTKVSNQLVFVTPYVVTLIVLAFSSQRLRPPMWDGRPWRKGMEFVTHSRHRLGTRGPPPIEASDPRLRPVLALPGRGRRPGRRRPHRQRLQRRERVVRLGLCAECGLVSALASSGGGRLVAVVTVAADGQPVMPCGRCRQLLWEHGGPACLVDGDGTPKPMTEILPGAFDATEMQGRTEE